MKKNNVSTNISDDTVLYTAFFIFLFQSYVHIIDPELKIIHDFQLLNFEKSV